MLARRHTDPVPPGTPTDQTPTAPAVRIRFQTRGGAQVHVHTDNTLICQGCEHTDPHPGSPTRARSRANSHAEGCYSMPKPTRDA